MRRLAPDARALSMTDSQSARAQWKAQLTVIRASERRLSRVLAANYRDGLDKWVAIGVPDIPIEGKRAMTAVLARMWRDATIAGGDMVVDQDKGAYPKLETKQDKITLFEQIMMDFIQRFGAVKVQQIMEATRNQIVRMIEKGINNGQGLDQIAKAITDAIPQLSRTRAHIIARTEVHTAAIHASQAVAASAPFPMNKRWISVFDHRTRDFGEGDGIVDQFNHRAMNEVTVGPDQMFEVPSKNGMVELMTGPGDPGGSPGNVINCRCALIYRRVGRPWPKTGEA